MMKSGREFGRISPSQKNPRKETDTNFNADKPSEKAATRRVTRQNEVWEVDFAILDVPGRPQIVAAVNVDSRLPTVAAVTDGTGVDIVAKLDGACRQFGYPGEIRIEDSFEVSSPALREWSEQHDVTVVFRPPGSPAKKAILERLHFTFGGKPSP
jgi:hypothetical protein